MRREELLERLQHKVLVLDGAMGTMLQRYGLGAGEAPEAFNLKAPEKIREIHEGYLRAGADILQTNTFGGNRIKLAAHGMEDDVQEINQRAVEVARSVANGKVLVAASMGPTGRFLEPIGDLPFDECYQVFKEQVSIVADAGVDIISIETMSDIYEMKACLLAVRDATDLPVMAHMTFGDNLRTLAGTEPAVVAAVLEAEGADVVGANCSLGPAELVRVLEEMAAVASIPLVVQPNAGIPAVVGGEVIYPVTPEEMGKYAVPLVKAGANIVGGCCGTTPEHISAVRRAVADLKPPVKSRKNIAILAGWRTLTVLPPPERTVLVSDPIDIVEAGGDLTSLAMEQKKLGAHLLHLRIPSGIDPKPYLYDLQMAVDIPLLIDNGDLGELEGILKLVMGKAWVRLPVASEEMLEKVLPVTRRFGAGLVIPTEDYSGAAENVESALRMVREIAVKGVKGGIPRHEVFIDVRINSGGLEVFDDIERLETFKGIWKEFGFRVLESI